MPPRLSKIRITDWRSVGDIEFEILHDVPTLLYGENNAGKSNILAAVEAFCTLLSYALANGHTRTGDTFGWTEHQTGLIPTERRVILAHPIRYDAPRAILVGELLNDTGEKTTLRFDITREQIHSGGDEDLYRKIEVTQFDGSIPNRAPTVLRIGEGRTFHAEFLPSQWSGKTFSTETVFANGKGIKLALFQCANHTNAKYRARFYDVFRDLLQDSPFALPAPVIALGNSFGNSLELLLLLDDHPIEEYGAGTQQWVLAAGMIAAVSPDLVLFEEPETNLSWKTQQWLVQKLSSMTKQRQILAATHSPHLVNMASSTGCWYRIDRDAESKATCLTTHQGVDALWGEYQLSLEQVTDNKDPRKLTLFPGNLIRLHDAAVRHLGVSEGDVVITSLQGGQTLQMKSLERWLTDDESSQ